MLTSVLRMPENIMAETDEQRGKLMTVLVAALEALEKPHTKVRLDFSRTAKLFPGGTLVLLAYVELMLEFFPGRLSARCTPHSLAAQLLRHFGVADALRIDPASSVPRHPSVLNWRYVTGSTADGAKVSELIDSFRRVTTDEMQSGLYDVLSEALTNVRHHAYAGAENFMPESLRRWWIFASYREPTNSGAGNLYIAVYDLGVGIQNSMRERLRRGELLLSAQDEIWRLVGLKKSRKLTKLLLERAVEHSRSRTGLRHRGRGLPEMRDFVMATESGRMHIISGGAQYSYSAGKMKGDTIVCNTRFRGTLLLWGIPLQPKESAL